MWWLAAAWILIDCCMNGLIFWSPIIIESINKGSLDADEDLDEDDRDALWHSILAALLSTLPFTLSAVVMVLNARNSRDANERHWHTAAPLLVAAAGMG